MRTCAELRGKSGRRSCDLTEGPGGGHQRSGRGTREKPEGVNLVFPRLLSRTKKLGGKLVFEYSFQRWSELPFGR